MFTKFIERFSATLYVQIWERRLKVTNVTNRTVFDDSPTVVIRTTEKGHKVISGIGKNAASTVQKNEVVVNPFSHPRALLCDFYVGEKLLQHAFKTILNTSWLRPRPKVIIHPMEKIEGGLTAIEERAFTELALGAGASAIALYVGKPLEVQHVDFEKLQIELRTSTQSEPPSQSTSNVGALFIWIAMITFAIWHFSK